MLKSFQFCLRRNGRYASEQERRTQDIGLQQETVLTLKTEFFRGLQKESA